MTISIPCQTRTCSTTLIGLIAGKSDTVNGNCLAVIMRQRHIRMQNIRRPIIQRRPIVNVTDAGTHYNMSSITNVIMKDILVS